jgi:hypothetical protein
MIQCFDTEVFHLLHLQARTIVAEVTMPLPLLLIMDDNRDKVPPPPFLFPGESQKIFEIGFHGGQGGDDFMGWYSQQFGDILREFEKANDL